MRKLLICALLFAAAAAAQAQEPVAQEPLEPASTAETSVSAEKAPAAMVDLKTRSTTADAIDAATLRAPVDVDTADQDITAPRNFWWLVGAIVLGGLILALLL